MSFSGPQAHNSNSEVNLGTPGKNRGAIYIIWISAKSRTWSTELSMKNVKINNLSKNNMQSVKHKNTQKSSSKETGIKLL